MYQELLNNTRSQNYHFLYKYKNISEANKIAFNWYLLKTCANKKKTYSKKELTIFFKRF